MQFKDAMRLKRDWGEKKCDHPGFEKEHYLGAQTGDYVCTQCGDSFPKNEYIEITEKRKNETVAEAEVWS